MAPIRAVATAAADLFVTIREDGEDGEESEESSIDNKRHMLSHTDSLLIALLAFVICAMITFVLRVLYRQYRRRRRRTRVAVNMADATALARALRHASADADGSFAVSRLDQVDGCMSNGASLMQVNKTCPWLRLEKKEGLCAVCLEGMEIEQRARRLPCGHLFHDPCAVIWLVKANQCPVCRMKVVDEPDGEAKEDGNSVRSALASLRTGRRGSDADVGQVREGGIGSGASEGVEASGT